MVKLKVGKEKLRKLLRDLKSGNRPSNLQQTSSINRAQSGLGTPVPGSMGPPSTPGLQNQQLATSATPAVQGQIGSIEAPPPPPQGQPAHVIVSFPVSFTTPCPLNSKDKGYYALGSMETPIAHIGFV
jgi:SWI/SNF-related matrix-associated actin-dependent regulator of chromatin subfamily B protein 1